jgi:hypothetical protein
VHNKSVGNGMCLGGNSGLVHSLYLFGTVVG